jgi:hypothetical protein
MSRRIILPTSQPNHTGDPSMIVRMATSFMTSISTLRYLTISPSTTLPRYSTVKVRPNGLLSRGSLTRQT